MSLDGVRRPLDELFFVIATQNPIEFHGTYPLPESQMDRFALRFSLGYVEHDDEVAILSDQASHHPLDTIDACANREDLARMRRSIHAVRIGEELKHYIVDLIASTRHAEGVRVGASPRASLAFMKCARSRSLTGSTLSRRSRSKRSRCRWSHIDSSWTRRRVTRGSPPRSWSAGCWIRCRYRPEDPAPLMLRRLLFHNFYVVYRTDQWVKSRFTPLGALCLGMLFIAVVFGLNTRATLSYQLASLALAVMMLGILSAPFFRARFSVSRQLPSCGTVGERLRYAVRVRSESPGWQRGLAVAERFDLGTPSLDEFQLGREPGDARRNWSDRNVGYPRWAGLMRRRRGASIEPTEMPDLPPGRSLRVDMELTPIRRGFIRFAGLDILRPDPLGIFKARVRIAQPDSLLVLPRRYRVQWLDLSGGSRDRAGGLSQGASIGGSDEFASLREYRPGDPLRHIHWKGWARHGTPIVKEFHEQHFARQALILDTYLPERGTRTQFEEAVSVGASFAMAASMQRGIMDLLFAGDKVYRETSGPGLGTTDGLLEALACVRFITHEPFALLQDAVWAHASELSGCICVMLDWDEARRDFIESLRSLDLPLLVLVMTVPGEGATLDPGPMSDQPERFRVLTVAKVAEQLSRL